MACNSILSTTLITWTSTLKELYYETEEFLLDKMPSFDTFIEILGRLYVNGFEIYSLETMETYGWGVFLGPRQVHSQYTTKNHTMWRLRGTFANF